MASQPSFRILLSTCLSLLICVNSFSQKQAAGIKNSFPFPAFDKITTAQGISSNEVNAIVQDRKGFLWILTLNGLNRYDGYSFKIYNYDPADSNSLTAGYFYSLEEDKNGSG
jgi:ligand-binding sensor domain-containing protein